MIELWTRGNARALSNLARSDHFPYSYISQQSPRSVPNNLLRIEEWLGSWPAGRSQRGNQRGGHGTYVSGHGAIFRFLLFH